MLHLCPLAVTVKKPMHDEFPKSFSQTFHVRYDECSAGRALRAAVHLRLFQEVAFGHSAALGFPLSWYEAQRLFWVVRRIHLVVHARAKYGDALTYTTQVQGARRVMARRVNTARQASDGALVASCVTDWIFTQDGVTPTRIVDALAAAFPGMLHPVAPSPLDEPRTPAGASLTPLHIRAADLDGVGHVNNPVYLDLFDDAVIRAGGLSSVAAVPRTYDLQYQAAATAGAAIQDVAWRDGAAWSYRLERAHGGLVLHGRLAEGERAFGA
jgi:acyl-CoA thioesterase FadM